MVHWSHRLILVTAVVAVSDLLPAQLSGSIYTTDSKGLAVNQNVYGSSRAVWIGGGPGLNSPCSAAGLPSGDYYFQVTDPSGSTLLTVDSVANRRVTVSNGVISAYSGTRKKGNGPCSSVIVQLFPYLDTPNSGGEHKVWLTPVARYDLTFAGSFGFHSRYSKSDNFKVRAGKPVLQSIIRGFKFFDYNANGVWDSSVTQEVPIPGWRVELLKLGVPVGVAFTDDVGRYVFMQDQDGATYTVKEVPPPPGFVPAQNALWHPTTAIQQVVVANVDTVLVPDFGNISFNAEPTAGLARSKGFWHNQGRAELLACDPLWREALNGTPADPVCLRRNISSLDPLVSIFTVPMPPTPFDDAFALLAAYLVGDPAYGHAGFILSTQVAATLLNQACGPISQYGIVAVDVRGDNKLVPLPKLIAGVKVLLCDPRAGMTGPGQNEDLRAMMLGCINEFEQVNNESGAVHTPSPTPATFSTPYSNLF